MKPTLDPNLPATPAYRPRVDVVVVTRDQEFAALRDSWNALAQAIAAPTVFLTHEWFSAAWAWRRHDAELALVLMRQAGALIGILPLVSVRMPSSRTRRLELLTVPDTQQCDMIVTEGSAAAASAAIAAALAGRRDWDLLALDYLASDGVCARWLVPALRHERVLVSVHDRGHNAFVALGGAWDDYYRTRSRRLKKALNLAANRLAKSGTVTIDWFQPGSGSEEVMREKLATVIDISARSWKGETGNSLGAPGPQAFIRALSDAAYRCGWLSVWTIRVGDRPVAMEYQLISGGRVHALRADFVDDGNTLSPGSHLFRQLLEALFARGLERYYLGPGDNPYKKRWSDEGEPMVRATAYQRTVRGRVAYWRDEIAKPFARTVRDRLQRPREKGDKDAVAGAEAKSDAKPDAVRDGA